MTRRNEREREALNIAYRELCRIGRLGGFKKSVGAVLAAILALVPDLEEPPCT